MKCVPVIVPTFPGSQGAPHRQQRRGGFTFVELMFGMAITVLVGGALAAFSLAMSKSWTDSEASQSVEMTANQATLRITPIMQDAKITGLVRAGSLDGSARLPAVVVFWKSDDNADDAIQIPELAMLEHSTADQAVVLYEVELPSTYSQAQIDYINSVPVTMDDMNDSDAPETFKKLIAQIDSTYEPRPLAVNVAGAVFEMKNATSETQRPSFVYQLQIEKNALSELEYGTATLRGAVTPDE